MEAVLLIVDHRISGAGAAFRRVRAALLRQRPIATVSAGSAEETREDAS